MVLPQQSVLCAVWSAAGAMFTLGLLHLILCPGPGSQLGVFYTTLSYHSCFRAEPFDHNVADWFFIGLLWNYEDI